MEVHGGMLCRLRVVVRLENGSGPTQSVVKPAEVGGTICAFYFQSLVTALGLSVVLPMGRRQRRRKVCITIPLVTQLRNGTNQFRNN